MRAVLNTLMVVALTIAWSLVAFVVLPFSPRRGIAFIGKRWSRSLAWVCAVSIDYRDTGVKPPPAIVMANHTSYFDVISMFAALPFPVSFVAKRELVLLPVFGQLLAAGAAIIIDRGNRERAMRSIARARRFLDRGQSVAFFPEGTRTPPGALGPLKKGGFHLAIETRAPIVPIGIAGTGQVMPKEGILVRPGRVAVRVGAPIPTEGLPDTEEGRAALIARVEAELRGLMGEAEASLAG